MIRISALCALMLACAAFPARAEDVAAPGREARAIGGNLGPGQWEENSPLAEADDEGRPVLIRAEGVSGITSSMMPIPDDVTHVRVRAAVKTRGIDDFDISYNAALYVVFHDTEKHFIVRREMVDWVNGTTDWTVLERTIPVPAEMAGRLRLVLELSKTRGGEAFLRDARVDSVAPDRDEPSVRVSVESLRLGGEPPVRFEGEDDRFVLSNLFGDRLDPVLGFRVDLSSETEAADSLTLETRILDHENRVLWRAERPSRRDEAHEFAVSRRGAGEFPLDSYLRFEARAVGPDGSVLGDRTIPFGILSQDGDLESTPVPGAVARASLSSPFGTYPCNTTIDRNIPDFQRKSLFALRMSGADWVRAVHEWIQPAPTNLVEVASAGLGEIDRLPTGPFNFMELVWMGRPHPEWWTENAPPGVHVGDPAPFEHYVRRACADLAGTLHTVTFLCEPDFRDPDAVAAYVAFQQRVAAAVKEACPGVRVASPGFNSGKEPLETYLKAGVGRGSDIIDIHSYATSLSLMEEWMIRHRELVDQYAPGKELWSAEIAPRWTVANDPRQMADRLVKIYVIGLRRDFKKLFWFNWRPRAFYRWDAALVEEDRRVTPRPAWFAYRTLVSQLRDHTFAGELAMGEGVRAFRFSGPAERGEVVVLWRRDHSAEPVGLEVGPSAGPTVQAIDYLGLSRHVDVVDGRAEIAAPHPVFVRVAPAPRASIGRPARPVKAFVKN
jgi:hypothetical protein